MAPPRAERGRPSGTTDSSLTTRAHRVLKERIITAEWLPGTRVTEVQLSRELGIGKTPIREALGRLVGDGLIQSRPRVGYEVAPITLRDVHELFGLRVIVEPQSAALAAGRVDGERLRLLDELCAAGYTVGDRKSIRQWVAANTDFHVTVAEATGNQRLVSLIRSLLEESERLFYISMMLRNRSSEMAHEHRELVEALASGDEARAHELAVRQTEASRAMTLEAIVTSTMFLAAEVPLPGSPPDRPDKVDLRPSSGPDLL